MSSGATPVPQMTGHPGFASWHIARPLRNSMAATTRDPARVTGPDTPGEGIVKIDTGTPASPNARAGSMFRASCWIPALDVWMRDIMGVLAYLLKFHPAAAAIAVR